MNEVNRRHARLVHSSRHATQQRQEITLNNSVLSLPPTSAVNVTLPVFAAKRRRLQSPAGGARNSRTTLLLSDDGTDGRTDGRTLVRFIDPALHTLPW